MLVRMQMSAFRSMRTLPPLADEQRACKKRAVKPCVLSLSPVPMFWFWPLLMNYYIYRDTVVRLYCTILTLMKLSNN